MAGLPRASVGTAKHCHGLPVEEAPHDEVKDAIRAQCARETSLGHREVREEIHTSNAGVESWTGIGVVAGFGAVILLRQGPHTRHVDASESIKVLQR